MRTISRLFAIALAWGLAGPAVAASYALPSATSAPTRMPTSVPYGWIDFCSRRPAECAVEPLAPAPVRLTQEVWTRLVGVNASVNASIEPVSNLEHWGTIVDHWDYPTDGKGDCKIFALAKRKALLELGFPRQALLMTIVRDLNGDGHTILTVRTDRGDFVLDNLSAAVRPWDATGYRYVKRQSESDPNVWLEIEGWGKPQARTARSY